MEFRHTIYYRESVCVYACACERTGAHGSESQRVSSRVPYKEGGIKVREWARVRQRSREREPRDSVAGR